MTALRFLLNSDFTGANAFIALADADGALRAAGLDLRFTPGRGAWTAAGRLARDGAFDLAYGDLNALVEIAGTQDRSFAGPSQERLHPLGAEPRGSRSACADRDGAKSHRLWREPDPGEAWAGGDVHLPQAIFMVHQQVPSTITVARRSAIHTAADLAGRHIVGHASDVALKTFPLFASTSGLTPDTVKISTSDQPMRVLLQDLLDGRCDAVFGYVTTHTAALAGAGLLASDCVRFLPYRDVCPVLYGSALMASPTLVREQPQLLWRLVRVLRASIAAAQASPETAIDAVLARAPSAQRAIETERWRGTLEGDMGLQDSTPDAGWGDVDDQRLSSGISNLAAACGWPSIPRTETVFTRRFLGAEPPL